MPMGESLGYLAKSRYVRDLATLVVAYGISINLVEVTWKAKIKAQYPNPNDYSAFMGCVGFLSLLASRPSSWSKQIQRGCLSSCAQCAFRGSRTPTKPLTMNRPDPLIRFTATSPLPPALSPS